MNQVQRVLNSKAPTHKMSDRKYKGAPPSFAKVTNPRTGLEETVKTSKGIPFVRVAK